MKTYTLFPDSKRQVIPWYELFRPYVILFTAHFLVAQASYFIYPSIAPAIIWPSAGIALAGLVIGGRKLWPAITIASLVNSILIEQPGELAMAIAFGSTVQAVFGSYVLERFGFDAYFARIRDAVTYIGTSFFVSAVGPLAIVSMLFTVGNYSTAGFTYQTLFGFWWLASLSGILIVGSFLIRWSVWPQVQLRSQTIWIESIVTTLLVGILSFVLAWTPYNSIFGISLVYILLIPFFWIAFRVGPRFMTLSIFAMTMIFLTGVAWGWNEVLSDGVLSGLTLSVVFSVIFLLLVAANEERKDAIKAYENYVDELESLIKQVRAEERMKTEFIAILAHELRNPLAPVLSSIELIKYKGAKKQERTRILVTMEERVRTMGRLLDDLLDVSRINQNKLKLHFEVVDIIPIAERALESVGPVLEEKHLTLHVSMPRRQLLARVDPVRIEQIMMNLLTNAVKYTDEEGEILFSLQQKKDRAVLSVKDTGVGIPINMLDLIFEPFIQLDPSTKRRASTGLGIGLSLCKKLTELHKGTIQAKSEGRGKGAEFIVTIPIPESVQLILPKAETIVTKAPAPELEGERILVVDDNKIAAESLAELLSLKGYKTQVAYSGEEAFSAAARFDPDLILLDIGLPDINGHEVAERLKQQGIRASLIALSGYGQDEDKIKAKQAGFAEHVTKPVGIQDLERVLRHVLRIGNV